jgi:hypothetical protein
VFGIDRDLPHEKGRGLSRPGEAGDEPTDPGGGPRHDGGLRKVSAPQDVAIGRIEIQAFRIPSDAPQFLTVFESGGTELNLRDGRLTVPSSAYSR